jgi:hypothetical protein
LWSELSEEYFVFELPPMDGLCRPELLGGQQSPWLAGLVRLDGQPLSSAEIAESLRLCLSYRPDDLFVADWAAAVLIDRDCDETLQVIEFANLQLLEFREIDNRLDDRLATAYGFIHSLARSRLPFWRFHTRQVRALGELKVEANSVFERTGNALKLVGDQYLARAYRLLASRFHLDAWEQSIKRSLDVLESVYRAVSNQAATYRLEFLEAIIEEAGADALELNIYFVATDPETTGEQVEHQYLDLVGSIRQAVKIPLAVKIGPYFSSMANMAKRLVQAGAPPRPRLIALIRSSPRIGTTSIRAGASNSGLAFLLTTLSARPLGPARHSPFAWRDSLNPVSDPPSMTQRHQEWRTEMAARRRRRQARFPGGREHGCPGWRTPEGRWSGTSG